MFLVKAMYLIQLVLHGDFSSNATNIYSKFSVTPVRNENISLGNALPSNIFITALVATPIDQGANADDDANLYASGFKADDKEDESNPRHSIFDIKK